MNNKIKNRLLTNEAIVVYTIIFLSNDWYD